MSVPTYNRNESKILFIEFIFVLNSEIGKLVSYMPVRYQRVYGDILIRYGLDALNFATQGNSIYLSATTSQLMFDHREWSFIQARSRIYSIASIYRDYVDITARSGLMTSKDKRKAIKRCERAIDMCNNCIALISKVMKSDRERYAAYQAKKLQNVQNMMNNYQQQHQLQIPNIREYVNAIQDTMLQTSNTPLLPTFVPINPFIHLDSDDE